MVHRSKKYEQNIFLGRVETENSLPYKNVTEAIFLRKRVRDTHNIFEASYA